MRVPYFQTLKLNQEYLGNSQDRNDNLNNEYIELNNNKNIIEDNSENILKDIEYYEKIKNTLNIVVFSLFVVLVCFVTIYFLLQKIR